jgi:predicted component of type VI protein secretion system
MKRSASPTKAAILVVVKGVDEGARIDVRPGHCVLIGRSPWAGEAARRNTGMLTAHSQQRLQREDHAVVERHLQSRKADHDRAHDAFASFERDADATLGDEAVSSTHAMIFVDDAGASLLDLGSTNGCFVNGAATTSSELADGDLIRVGETRLSVRLEAGPT